MPRPSLLVVDCPTGRVRRYKPSPYGGVRCMEEVEIIRPQQWDLPDQLESFRSGRAIVYAIPEPGAA